MITQNEISSLNLSPTKKDFVQIWNELIEVSSKITERWDPTSTNESDPGIVLLKALTGIADKLNYNIDKNILEAYMPTAAQMESMRKLCELVGYDIKYYQSAETKVRISYTGNTTDLSNDNDEKLPIPGGLAIPKFTTITNADKDIVFITTNTNPALLSNTTPWVDVPCIEGQISQCESINEGNLITLAQLDNNRYYLPEIQIAENGIFVFDATTKSSALADGEPWTQVSNLNTQPAGSKVFKFSYDSFESRPYLAFPDDVGSLIGDGLFIYYTRTSGLSGNISPRKLEILELPTGDGWDDYSAEQFEVVNFDATTNGANIESISTAYSNFKKTIGTFDTLVTCRDYMNKIYSLMNMDNTPYVSNILVTDIRNDINGAVTLCSCNEYGILYKEMPLTRTDKYESAARKIVDTDKAGVYKLVINNTEAPVIDHFDLVLYPFKTFTQVSQSTEELAEPYNASFKYTENMNKEISAAIEDLKTCAHNLRTPNEGDVVAINNYLRLDALVATSTRVSELEAEVILQNIKVALVNEFNLRNLDFGEEIPFDSILSVIENADPRIKVVSLQEPTVLTTYSVKEYDDETNSFTSKEYGIASSEKDEISGAAYGPDPKGIDKAKEIYNKLMLRNILAGRAELFDYDIAFESNNSEKPYTITECIYDNGNLLDSANTLEDILNDPDPTEKNKLLNLLNSFAYGKALGEYIVSDEDGNPVLGPSGGVLTLSVSEAEQTQAVTYTRKRTAARNTPETKNKVYETYEPYKDTGIINNISSVEAACEISSSTVNEDGENVFKNITLAKNEVIKFRAPNLITTKTYPAYVYYRFERGTTTTQDAVGNGTETQDQPSTWSMTRNTNSGNSASSTDGSYASITALASFVTAVNKGQMPEKFFTGLWKANESRMADYEFKANLNTQDLGVAQTNKLPNIFSTSIAVGTDIKLTPEDEAPLTLVFTKQSDLTEYINAISTLATKDEDLPEGVKKEASKNYIKTYVERFVDESASAAYCTVIENFATAVLEGGTPGDEDEEVTTEIVFKYYPLVGGTLTNWSSYVRSCYEELYGTALPDGTVLYRLSTTSNHPKGKLVVESGQRLYAQDGDYLSHGDVGNSTYICASQGSEPTFYTVPENGNVELRPASSSSSSDGSGTVTNTSGDRLYIHYTPSSTNEDGETQTAEPISIVYESTAENPIIIKPVGFNLVPSEDVYRQGTSWKKTDVDFGEYGKQNLLSLGANEQIEMRSISKVVLDSPARFYKNFDNAELEKGDVNNIINYELKDGEYIFYTDQNNTDAAYYGSGCVITLKNGARIPKAREQVEVSQILEQGLRIVPWSDSVILNAAADRTVTITEYQYRTLVEGDTLNLLTVDTDTAETVLSSKNGWTKCISTTEKPIKYTPAGAESAEFLDIIDLRSGLSTSWEVCSFLELSTSPAHPQELRVSEQASGKIVDKVTIVTDTGTGENPKITLTPSKTVKVVDGKDQETYEPMSVKLNLVVQTASGNFEKTQLSGKKAEKTDVKLKVFKEQAPSLLQLTSTDDPITPISAVNAEALTTSTAINNYWTGVEITGKLVPKKEEDGSIVAGENPAALALNFMIPKDSDIFGVFSIYLAVSDDTIDTGSQYKMLTPGSRVFIDVPDEFGAFDNVINIYNYQKDGTPWWPTGTEPTRKNRVYLRAGLNCIQIKKSCSLLIKAEEDASGSIIYDNMRLVKGVNTHGINLTLLDPDAMGAEILKNATEETKKKLAESLLQDIAKLDKNHEFYYNVPVENSLAIEFDNNINSFSNPRTLYDINNINNNFVVSKLDIAYLVDEDNAGGIRIAKSSKY